MSERKQKLEAIFQAAVELGSPEQQDHYLSSACAGEPELRSEVEELLKAAVAADALFQVREALQRQDGTLRCQPALEQPGSVIERYKLLEKVGEGGCGVVYVAEQVAPVRRRVALKVIKLGMDTRSVVARFEAERQALAMMDHPNIAKVLDAGATETGRPYFVMELVRGTKITEYCDQNQLSTAQRLELFLQVCRAVQHAHQKGIIHRDLKPSNILVTVNDGVAVPKVIDFGIAKATEPRLTDKTVYTELHQFIGTPAYMSPEQAEMTSVDIDTRSDIYGLGVLLYELLTGRTPFDQQELLRVGLDEMRKTIRMKEPPRPSTRLSTLAAADLSTVAKARRSEPPKLIHLVRGDLDWIVMKCLEKERARRYETASGLARDVERHLHHEPVVARPPSRVYEFRKIVHRHWVGFSAASAVLAALALGAAISALEALRARKAQHAEQRLVYAANMKLVQEAWQQKQIWRVRQILEETANYPDRAFEWYYWQRQLHLPVRTLRGHLDRVRGVAFSPDGLRLATASYDRLAKVWDAASGREILTLTGHRAGVTAVAFSPDGRRIVTASLDKTAKVWDAASGEVLLTLGHTREVFAVAFSPDGRRIVTGSVDKTAEVWDAINGHELFALSGHTAGIFGVAFSPDGHRIVTGSDDKTARVWDAANGTELFSLTGHEAFVTSLAISADGRQIVTGSGDRTARLWDATTGRVLATLRGHSEQIRSVAFSPDGTQVVTASADTTTKVWDASSGNELYTLVGGREDVKGPNGWILCVAFSPDGHRILTGSNQGVVKLWAADGAGPIRLSGHNESILRAAFSPDGRRIATGGVDHTLRLWDAESGLAVMPPLQEHSLPIPCLAFSPDGRQIVSSSIDGTARLWDSATGSPLQVLRGHAGGIWATAFFPDGRRVVTGGLDKTVRTWDSVDGHQLSQFSTPDPIVALAVSADGRRIVAGSDAKNIRMWDAATAKELLRLEAEDMRIRALAFSPDGFRIAVCGESSVAWVYDPATGRKVFPLQGHGDQIFWVGFSTDGRRIVTGSLDQTAKVWDATTGKDLLTLPGHDGAIWCAAFSPNGQRLITANDHGTANVWPTATPDQVTVWKSEDLATTETLAALARERNAALERERALRAQDPGTLRQWLVLGPIHLTIHDSGEALAENQVSDEARLRPRPDERVRAAWGEASWRAFQLGDYQLDFSDVLVKAPVTWAVAYAVCYVVSDRDQFDLKMNVGSDHECKVYLNGKERYRCLAPDRFYERDQDQVTGLTLRAGPNVVVFKVVCGDPDNGHEWRGSIRLTDAADQPLKGIRVTLTPPAMLPSEDPGGLRQWLVLAPIHFEGTNGADALGQQQLPDEAHLHPRSGAPCRAGRDEVFWQESRLEDYALDFTALTKTTNTDYAVAYAVCYIQSETNQPGLIMRVGSDDQSKVYLNGKEIYRCEKPRAFLPDEDQVSGVSLNAGINVLVFKVVNELGGWQGSIRLTDALGHSVKGVRVTLTPPSI